MAERGAGLFLTGLEGVGKTSIACLVAKEARKKGFSGFFTSTFDLRENMRAKVSFDEDRPLFTHCREVDLLVLDSFEEADFQDMFVNLRLVQDLLSARAAQLKVTVVTSRVSPINPAIQQLLSLGTNLVQVQVEGENMRKVQRASLENLIKGQR
jgi:DNA replication protein DnaC